MLFCIAIIILSYMGFDTSFCGVTLLFGGLAFHELMVLAGFKFYLKRIIRFNYTIRVLLVTLVSVVCYSDELNRTIFEYLVTNYKKQASLLECLEEGKIVGWYKPKATNSICDQLNRRLRKQLAPITKIKRKSNCRLRRIS